MADNKNTQAADVNEQIKIRMDKLKALQDAGKDPFQITKYDVTHHTDEIRAIYEAHEKELLGDRPAVNTEGLDEQQAREAVNADYNERRAIMDASPIEVSFAGRMMFKRVMGKASFCNIADLKGKMQAYISKDAIWSQFSVELLLDTLFSCLSEPKLFIVGKSNTSLIAGESVRSITSLSIP